MTTKKVILLSAAICLAINLIVWLLGWLIWPIGFLAVWLSCGYLGWRIDKKYTRCSHDLGMSLYFGPICLMCAFFDYKREILAEIGFPKFRNPFVWAEKEEK